MAEINLSAEEDKVVAELIGDFDRIFKEVGEGMCDALLSSAQQAETEHSANKPLVFTEQVQAVFADIPLIVLRSAAVFTVKYAGARIADANARIERLEELTGKMVSMQDKLSKMLDRIKAPA